MKNKHRQIIDLFASIAAEGARYEDLFKRIMRELSVNYNEIRKAFKMECDVDIGNKKKMYERVVDAYALGVLK